MNDNPVDLLQIKIERAKEQLPVETLNAIAAVDWRASIMRLREKKGYNFEQLGALEIETELLLCGLINSNDYPKEVQRRMNISRAETDEIVNEMNISVFKKIKEELIKNAERKKIFEQRKEEQKSYEVEKIPFSPTIKKQESFAEMKMRSNGGEGEVLKSAGIDVVRNDPAPVATPAMPENREDLLKKIEHPSSSSVVEPTRGEAGTPHMGNSNTMLKDKILGSVQVPIVKTEHTMENVPDTNIPVVTAPEIAEASSLLKKDPYRLSPDE